MKTIGNMEDYGLPKPDHRPLDAHPSVSGEFLTRVGCGDIVPKGGIDRLDGDGVVFTDGSREQIDAIVWATGYNVTFPFLAIADADAAGQHVPAVQADGEARLRDAVLPRAGAAAADARQLRRAAVQARRRQRSTGAYAFPDAGDDGPR